MPAARQIVVGTPRLRAYFALPAEAPALIGLLRSLGVSRAVPPIVSSVTASIIALRASTQSSAHS